MVLPIRMNRIGPSAFPSAFPPGLPSALRSAHRSVVARVLSLGVSIVVSIVVSLLVSFAAGLARADERPVLAPGDYRIEVVLPAGASAPADVPMSTHWCVASWRDRWPALPPGLGDAPDERWRAVDDAQWLRTLTGRPPAGLPPGPGGVAVVQALTPAVDALEHRLGSPVPAESAKARRELAALREHLHLRGRGDAPPPDPPRRVITQRWTRVSASCDDELP